MRWLVWCICLLGITLLGSPVVGGNDALQHFRIDNVVGAEWGKLVSVYDQPTYQRFTFESDSQITILHVGLIWDNRENAYRPNVRQVIHLRKMPEK